MNDLLCLTDNLNEKEMLKKIIDINDNFKLNYILTNLKGEKTYNNFIKVYEEDNKIANILLFKIKLIENYLRNLLIKDYGEVAISKRNYMYELSNSIGAHLNPIACDTLYPKFLPERCFVADYLRSVDLETLIRCYLILPKDKITNYKITDYKYDYIADNLYSIKRVKSTILNGGAVIYGFDYKFKYDDRENCIINGEINNLLDSNIKNIDFIISKII